MIFAFAMKYWEARKHWWFIDPNDLSRAFLACAVMCIFLLLWAVVTRGKEKPLKLPITLWIGCGLAVLLIALSVVMSKVQGPSPMY
jgi:ABC-type iron transport system FetAB permease component